jgi:hypothetical protein
MIQSARRGIRSWEWRAKAILLPLAVLSVICAGIPAMAQTAQSSGPLMSYPFASLNGLQSAELKKSLEDCRKICSDRSGCVGFDHTPSTNQCRIFAAVNSARDNAEATAETRYPINGFRTPAPQQQQPTTPEPAEERSFTLYVNHDVFGNDLDVFASDSLPQCQQACADNAQCSVFTFNAWNKKCFLKERGDDLRLDPRATTGIASTLGPPSYRESQVVMEYYHSYVISGRKIGQTQAANSRQQCENICWENDRCVAFSFAPRLKTCAMYDKADNRFSSPDFESGAKIQPRP